MTNLGLGLNLLWPLFWAQDIFSADFCFQISTNQNAQLVLNNFWEKIEYFSPREAENFVKIIIPVFKPSPYCF